MKDRLPERVSFRPIGVIRSGHTDPAKTPIQPVYSRGCQGRAEILPEYEEGLRDLEGFSHIYVVFYLHRAEKMKLTVEPFLDTQPRGVFATRSPNRPNAIGLSLVKLIRREDNVLFLDEVDMLDGTPILDVKPYSSRFDHRDGVRDGWLETVDDKTTKERGRRGFQSGENNPQEDV